MTSQIYEIDPLKDDGRTEYLSVVSYTQSERVFKSFVEVIMKDQEQVSLWP